MPAMPEAGLRLLFCTAPAEAAPTIARALLEAKLIGCANLLPAVRSLYWWEGAIQDDVEVVMLMECTSEDLSQAVAELERVHPYEVPKIVVIAPDSVNPPYLEWLRAVTRSE
jgi:periplasmic divalent cation tolerance protein